MSNFHPVEIVGRGSETQLQVGEILNNLIGALSVKAYIANAIFFVSWYSYRT